MVGFDRFFRFSVWPIFFKVLQSGGGGTVIYFPIFMLERF